MMRPALRSHRGDDDVQIYEPLQTDFSNAGTPAAAFAVSVHHVDPAIEQDISRYNHSHPDDADVTFLAHATNGSANVADDLPVEGVRSAALHSSASQSTPTFGHDNSTPSAHGHEGESASHVEHRIEDYTSQPLEHDPPHIPNSAPEGQFDMLPPPNSMHTSWQGLHEYAQTHASEHGYALSINTTAKNRARIKLACVCYGAPKNTHKLTPETRVRKNRASYKTGCKMWVEGKKLDDGLWMLRIGEPNHNHPGKAVEGWALQRKRTWGVEGGRVGYGGVTAREEKDKVHGVQPAEDSSEVDQAQSATPASQPKQSHGLERGGMVWRIVEQEMLRKGGPNQGRDRGVGRTVKVLEEKLPGIHIFKRDIYNIRAQIKRVRKAAGQQIGEGLSDDEDGQGAFLPIHEHGNVLSEAGHGAASRSNLGGRGFAEIDPQLVAQCNDALRSVTRQEEGEVERLRKENEDLRQALAQRDKEVADKASENEHLRAQVEMANLASYGGGHGFQHVPQQT